ncbi:MAG: hypothetical protein KKB34_13535 [Bacteroidetes bacterium]|nr:hypothetical protein [Bacteroidota bacterium]
MRRNLSAIQSEAGILKLTRILLAMNNCLELEGLQYWPNHYLSDLDLEKLYLDYWDTYEDDPQVLDYISTYKNEILAVVGQKISNTGIFNFGPDFTDETISDFYIKVLSGQQALAKLAICAYSFINELGNFTKDNTNAYTIKLEEIPNYINPFVISKDMYDSEDFDIKITPLSLSKVADIIDNTGLLKVV